MTDLYQAFAAAEQAAGVLQERLLDCQDEAALPELQEKSAAANAKLNQAREALLQSDEPRPWILDDLEGDLPLATVELRPSEVDDRLRAEVIAANSDGLLEAVVLKGYAHCEATGETRHIDVHVEPAVEATDD